MLLAKKIYIFLFSLFTFFKLGAQTCSIVSSSNIVCINNALNFSATYTAGLTPNTYAWNFGNGVTNTQPNPTYNYPTIGTFTPTLTIVFTNNSQCIITGNPIQVVALPIADFRILEATKQCFKGNLVCIKDSSRAGTSGSKIAKHTFLWGDGDFDTTVNFTDTICHNYKNIAGGLYSLILEVTDSNGCLTRLEKNNAMTILPKMETVSFTCFSTSCDTTLQTIQNTSNLPLSKVKKFVWDFGDGNIDSSNTKWNYLTHGYAIPGFYYPTLFVTDFDNCKDTAQLYIIASKKVLDNKILITQNNKCYNKQFFVFNYKDAVLGDYIIWKIFNSNNVMVDSIRRYFHSVGGIKDSVGKFECGKYKITMEAFYGNNCKIKLDTTFDIYGPNTIFGDVGNNRKCNVNDTVIFRIPNEEPSCLNKNTTLSWFWDFDDGFAPPCTTDTKRGINVGLNCRYSKDSTLVKHKYYFIDSNCYNAKLTITDSINNCSDTDSLDIILSPPNAKPNLPYRRGLYYYTNPPGKFEPPLDCDCNEFSFNFDETIPSCGREEIWLNLDSAAGINNWVSCDPKKQFFNTSYKETADSNGWVTVGLIIKNGNCYDTAWYHRMFKLIKINPNFKIKFETKCAPYKASIVFEDSIQYGLDYALISIIGIGYDYINDYEKGIGLFETRNQVFNGNDSIIHEQLFNFKEGGIFEVTVTLKNKIGCITGANTKFKRGFLKLTSLGDATFCLKDSITYYERYAYKGDATQYWNNKTRANANLERIYWNFGDTTGYYFYGVSPKHKYKKIGNYKISLIAQDSVGCVDTLENYRRAIVVDVKAAIAPITDKLLCAPKVIQFYDASNTMDSLGFNNYDFVKNWKWDFGDSKTISFAKNPVHDYSTNDSFKVQLIVTSNYGCMDSITLPLVIKGPTPKYSFLSGDTIGCSPVKFKMNNTTGVPLQSWQWTINGPENFIVSTDKDTNTNFSLVKAGRYRVLLLGTDSLVNEITGQTVYCTSVFPDTLNPNSKPVYVTVFDKPLVRLFGPDTVCKNDVFTILAKADTMYSQFLWQASNGFSLPLKPRTDSIFNYSFNDSGSYTVQLIPTPKISIACIDTGIHAIYVRNIKADFDIDESRSPIDSFINKSISATSYFWDFGQPSSGSNNFSNLQNPTHDYKSLVDTFKVCLVAQNAGACFDTLCKIIIPTARLLKIPNVFTPNNDGINDAFDIEILGQTYYEIKIYNRWGNKVFEGNADGKGNDGINWNGKTDNDGNQNSEGVYFYVFKYKFNDKESEKTLHGSIALIRQ
jgi:gliding motility-associated-like protein